MSPRRSPNKSLNLTRQFALAFGVLIPHTRFSWSVFHGAGKLAQSLYSTMKFLNRLAEAIGTLLGAVAAILAFPFLLLHKPSLDGVLDRTDWAVGDGSEVSPEEAVRPIHAAGWPGQLWPGRIATR